MHGFRPAVVWLAQVAGLDEEPVEATKKSLDAAFADTLVVSSSPSAASSEVPPTPCTIPGDLAMQPTSPTNSQASTARPLPKKTMPGSVMMKAPKAVKKEKDRAPCSREAASPRSHAPVPRLS